MEVGAHGPVESGTESQRDAGLELLARARAGDYFDGLAASMNFACAATDTLDQPMNSATDGLTGEALHWLGSGTCTSVIASGPGTGAAKGAAPADRFPRGKHPSAAEFWLPGIG